MTSTVFFIPFNSSIKENMLDKFKRLCTSAGIERLIKPRDLCAIKIHFGEYGNTAFIRPLYIRALIELLKNLSANPFVTDTNTLYSGTRSDSVSHLKTAYANGFSFSCLEAPLIIADGLRGKSETAVAIDAKHCKSVYMGNEIIAADSLISVAHFKLHEMTGFGGSLKNIGMGCASRRGKLEQHSTVKPSVNTSCCISCKECADHCSQKAFSFHPKAAINKDTCIGCGECILICPKNAISITWNQSIATLQEKMVEYCYGIIKQKQDRILYINFINSVSPHCDCYEYTAASIVRDIGIAASVDPVALDQASIDLINKEHPNPDSCLKSTYRQGDDKIKAIYPKIDWQIQLDYAQELGIGTRSYSLQSL